MSHAIAAAFDDKLRDVDAKGSLSHEDVLELYPPNAGTVSVPSLEQIEFYADFAISPADANIINDRARKEAVRVHGEDKVWEILASNKHHKWRKHRQYDFRLNDQEKARLQEHGLMVSERLGAKSFADVYYRLYTDDLPVFVTSDSILHAWHWSFDAFLTDLEVEELMPLLGSTLVKTLDACATQYRAAEASGNEAATRALAEVELYLTTAHRLLIKDPSKVARARAPKADESSWERDCRLREEEAAAAYEASLGKATALCVASNANRLNELLEMARLEQMRVATILGSARDVDFSLFKPRGHYVKSEKLMRYFRAMSWLGTVDFRVDGAKDPQGQAQNLFQLQCAAMTIHVLRETNALESIQTIYEIISAFAGDGIGADSMTPKQLNEAIGDRDILSTFFGGTADANLRGLQDGIANRGLGTQAINGHPYMEAALAKATRPATAFGILGQQFVWSAFIFSKLVFDQLFHDGAKVPRRIPSGVDVAFALFGNDGASDVIASRMTASPKDEDYVQFRDGLPYASSLIAGRKVVEELLAKADPETSSVALLWQLALRELSQASANSDPLFQSATWQKRVMNTQLASFTQLRHDTILYAKQGFSGGCMCEYPAGYVDPHPSFWLKMNQLAKGMLSIVDTLKLANKKPGPKEPYLRYNTVEYRANSCLNRFANVTQNLYEIATAQAQHQDLTEAQVTFLKSVMEESHGSGGTRYEGWYPSLFYTAREDSSKPDRLVADVHTDGPSDMHGDPGGILHIGVGDVNLAMVVIDKTVYAGPVFSHYEFVTPIDVRLTDNDFSARLPTLKAPKWARDSFLVTK